MPKLPFYVNQIYGTNLAGRIVLDMTFDKSKHPNYKEITLGELADAIEKNGLPKFTGSFYDIEEIGPEAPHQPAYIVAACAFGQAAINLDVSAPDLFNNVNELMYAESVGNSPEGDFFIGDYVVRENDHSTQTLPEIAAKLREKISNSSKYSLATKFFAKKAEFTRVDDKVILGQNLVK